MFALPHSRTPITPPGLAMKVMPSPSTEISGRSYLSGLFWPLRFTQAHARAAAVLVDELDAGQLQGPSSRQVISRRHGRLAVG